MKRAIASVLQAFAVFILFAIGFCLILLRYLPEARMQAAHQLFHEPDPIFFIGIGFCVAALLFGVGFYAVNRGRYLQIEMGTDTEIEIGLLQKMLEECFKTRFPKQIVLEGVECEEGNKLEIAVKLAPLAEADREALLRSAEQQLKQLLREKLGYLNPFYLTVRIR